MNLTTLVLKNTSDCFKMPVLNVKPNIQEFNHILLKSNKVVDFFMFNEGYTDALPVHFKTEVYQNRIGFFHVSFSKKIKPDEFKSLFVLDVNQKCSFIFVNSDDLEEFKEAFLL